jgi:hypothetical protein
LELVRVSRTRSGRRRELLEGQLCELHRVRGQRSSAATSRASLVGSIVVAARSSAIAGSGGAAGGVTARAAALLLAVVKNRGNLNRPDQPLGLARRDGLAA